MSSASDSPNATGVDDNSVVSSANKTQSITKKNKPAKTSNAIPCSMCNKKFATDAGRITHEQVKHKVGTLVEIPTTTSTDDSHNRNQPSGLDNESHNDLIAFTDDDDDDDCALSQPNLQTTTVETNRLVEVRDDDSNPSGTSFDSNDSVRLGTDLPENEKAIEIHVAKDTVKDD